jgi:hypothetical protein
MTVEERNFDRESCNAARLEILETLTEIEKVVSRRALLAHVPRTKQSLIKANILHSKDIV